MGLTPIPIALEFAGIAYVLIIGELYQFSFGMIPPMAVSMIVAYLVTCLAHDRKRMFEAPEIIVLYLWTVFVGIVLFAGMTYI